MGIYMDHGSVETKNHEIAGNWTLSDATTMRRASITPLLRSVIAQSTIWMPGTHKPQAHSEKPWVTSKCEFFQILRVFSNITSIFKYYEYFQILRVFSNITSKWQNLKNGHFSFSRVPRHQKLCYDRNAGTNGARMKQIQHLLLYIHILLVAFRLTLFNCCECAGHAMNSFICHWYNCQKKLTIVQVCNCARHQKLCCDRNHKCCYNRNQRFCYGRSGGTNCVRVKEFMIFYCFTVLHLQTVCISFWMAGLTPAMLLWRPQRGQCASHYHSCCFPTDHLRTSQRIYACPRHVCIPMYNHGPHPVILRPYILQPKWPLPQIFSMPYNMLLSLYPLYRTLALLSSHTTLYCCPRTFSSLRALCTRNHLCPCMGAGILMSINTSFYDFRACFLFCLWILHRLFLLYIDNIIRRACDVIIRMLSRSAKKLHNATRDVLTTEMPDFLWAHVFMFATQSLQKDFFVYKTVCKKWQQFSLEAPALCILEPQFTELTDRGCVILSESCKSLRFLHLFQCDITDMGLRALARLPFLATLYLLESMTVTSEGIQALGALTQLKELNIGDVCQEEEHGLKLDFVRKLKGLTKLRLYNLKITDVGLAGLKGMTSLVSLFLLGCHGSVTTPAILSALQHLDKLQSFTSLFHDEFIAGHIDIGKILSVLPKPRSLESVQTTIDDSKACILRDLCPELRVLGNQPCAVSPLTDIGIRSIFCTTHCLSERLYPDLNICTRFSVCQSTDHYPLHIPLFCIRAICDLTLLTELHLHGLHRCSEDCLYALSKLVNLQKLALASVENFCDDTLIALAPLVKLEVLTLNSILIQGSGFKYLHGLKKLHSLTLEACPRLDDHGVLEIAHAFKALRDLTICGYVYDPSIVCFYLTQCASPTLTHVSICGLGYRICSASFQCDS